MTPKTKEEVDLYLSMKNDQRDVETPFKAIICNSTRAIRFTTMDQAIAFFNGHQGRCLVSHVVNGKQKYIRYKFN